VKEGRRLSQTARPTTGLISHTKPAGEFQHAPRRFALYPQPKQLRHGWKSFRANL
jgi:hypothetical protein